MSITPQALRLTHASGLHAVGRVLADMHREMLRGSVEEGGMVRLSVLNLVAACVDVDSADLATQAVGRIGEHHPLRAIIILAAPDQPTAIEADLSLQCSITGGGQVCAEQVRLGVSGDPALHLASVVTPLLVPDTPVFLWLVGAPPIQQALGSDAIAICERMIIDSGNYDDAASVLATIAAESGAGADSVTLLDMAWERSRTWRRLVAESFDGEGMRRYLRCIHRVEIECSGARVSSQAWLLAGWLSDRLHWTDAPDIVTAAERVDGVEDHDLTRVVLHCRRDDDTAEVSVSRRDDALHVSIDERGGIGAERAVPYEVPNTVDMVGILLESAADDPVYRGALAAGARLAAGQG